jgi:hypothetical protein
MTAAKEAIKRLWQTGHMLPSRVTIADAVPKTTEAAKAVSERFGNTPPREPEPMDLEILNRRLLAAFEANRLDQVSRRDWRHAPWIFWQPPHPPLITKKEFKTAYASFVLDGTGAGFLKILVYVYLREFDFGKEQIGWVAGLIREGLRVEQTGLLETWRRRHRDFKLFDVTKGPRQVAERCLRETAGIEEILGAAGLTGQLEQGGMALAAWLSGLQDVHGRSERGLPLDERLERLLTWSVATDSTLRYPHCKKPLAEALLLPWLRRAPPPEVKERIQGFLLQALKDPRLFVGNWHGIDEDAITVMRRWLTGATLRYFFHVLDRNAQHYPEDHRRHWTYRRAFWLAYYEKDVLQEAWFAFAPEARQLANQVLKPEERAYGKLAQENGNLPNHAVLLMRISGLTVVEWSHNGKCRIWRQGDQNAPRLYKAQYSRSQLVRGSERIVPHYQQPGITHFRSEVGGWQQKVAGFIRQHTKIAIHRDEYMP